MSVVLFINPTDPINLVQIVRFINLFIFISYCRWAHNPLNFLD